ncbi:hypothetical protein [Paenibacillus thermotolerans]|uniref:hypothetical protein n=1 Tax=Paenibacillus thermotolerans TaxID=3027807 RepID=UPI002367BB9E|nr:MULTISPECIES: hypothetical protein [unclassified Paenibacillus]
MNAELLGEAKRIRVRKPETIIEIDNPYGFRLIGKGKQGAVFRIDDKRCVKLYYRSESLVRELHALRLGGQAGICPEVCFWGADYIVMEYITAPSLFDELQEHGMSKRLAEKIVWLLDTFERIGYNRFDHSARHIFMMPDDRMKIIDVVHVIKPKPVYFAKKLISDMGAHAPEFIEHVAAISPKWHSLWTRHESFAETMRDATK